MLIFLFFNTSNASVASNQLNEVLYNGKTWYVGGSGSNNFSAIQEAVNAADDFDTVYVYSGLYSDTFPYYGPSYVVCVVVNKSINLVGENKYSTIINGSGRFDVINVCADDVTIRGFTIQNGGESQYIPGTCRYGRGIYAHENNVVITDNCIIDNYMGVVVSGDNGVVNNNIFSVNRIGLEISSGANNIEAVGNSFSNHWDVGIFISHDFSTV